MVKELEMNPKYGQVGEKQLIDDSGSTMEVERSYHQGDVMYPVRRKYEVRHRLDNTDLQTMAKIVEDLLNDPKKLDKSFKIEPGKKDSGKYHLVECYTILVY